MTEDIKTIDININISETSYPRLFELQKENIPIILNKIIQTGYMKTKFQMIY